MADKEDGRVKRLQLSNCVVSITKTNSGHILVNECVQLCVNDRKDVVLIVHMFNLKQQLPTSGPRTSGGP